MGLHIEDELNKLKNNDAAEILVASFIQLNSDNTTYTIRVMGNRIVATALTGFSEPEAEANVVVIRSGSQYLLWGSLS